MACKFITMGITQLALGALLVTVVESSCQARRSFYAFPAKTYSGAMLYKHTKSTQTAEQCQRICNQVLKCTGFVINWAGPHGGYCNFFQSPGPSALQIGNAGTTVYLDKKCPQGFETYSPDSHCYQLVQPGMFYSLLQAHCTSLHQDAYVVEIQSAEENNGVRQMVVDKVGFAIDKLRLGASRAAGDTDRTAFKWDTSGEYLNTLTAYKTWKPQSPNSDTALLTTQRCMYGFIISTTIEMQWVDALCDANLPFVCELEIY